MKPVDYAKKLRKDSTDAEQRLWTHLRAHRFGAHKFKRQQPIGPYIVDFVCFGSRLVIEIDGGQHADAARSDSIRDAWLAREGFRILRFWNNEVLENTEGVMQEILLSLQAPSPQPSPASPPPLSNKWRGEQTVPLSPSGREDRREGRGEGERSAPRKTRS